MPTGVATATDVFAVFRLLRRWDSLGLLAVPALHGNHRRLLVLHPARDVEEDKDEGDHKPWYGTSN